MTLFRHGPPVTRRATVTDLARVAGVSVATVDRVLNQRHAVREDTARRVLRAAETLDYHATPLLRRRLSEDLPQRTLGFLLQKRSEPFYQGLAAEMEAAVRAAPGVRGRAVVQFMDEVAPTHIAASLREIGPKVDAVAVVAVDHPHVSAAVAALRARGVPTIALLSDLTAEARAGYVGVDGRKAGRTAGWTIARSAPRPGKVGIVVGSHRYLGHEMCEIGFRSYFREHAPDFHVLEAVVNLEERRLAYEASLALLARHADLVGIYVAGGGMEGVIQALRDEATGRRIAMVCHELTPENRAGLIDGVVTMILSTPPSALAGRAVDAMLRALASPAPDFPSQTILPFDVFIAENL